MTSTPGQFTTNATGSSRSLQEVVAFVGSTGAILCYFCVIMAMVGMGMRGIRTHIHCNVAGAFLLTHVLLLVGGEQVKGSLQCKVVALLTQVSYLVGFTWLLLEIVYLFGLSAGGTDGKETRNNYAGKFPPSTEDNSPPSRPKGPLLIPHNEFKNDHPCHEIPRYSDKDAMIIHRRKKRKRCMKLIIYYVTAWLGPMLYAGATFPAVVHGYGETKNCWLASDTSVIWVYGAPVPAIFVFHSLLALLAVKNFKRRIKFSQWRQSSTPSTSQGSAKTRTTLISTSEDGRSQRLSLQPSTSSQTPTPEHREGDEQRIHHEVESEEKIGKRRELIRTKAHRGVKSNRSSHRGYASSYRDYQDNSGGAVVYPPVHKMQRTEMRINIPTRDIKGPLDGYITTLHWQAWLVPCVTVVWAVGILSVNIDFSGFDYIFALLNILQAMIIFVFYCVVDYRLRQQFRVMTSRKVNAKRRTVSLVLDEEDVIDFETNHSRKRVPLKRFPNVDILNRTPTPFGRSRHRSVQFQSVTSPGDVDNYRGVLSNLWDEETMFQNSSTVNLFQESFSGSDDTPSNSLKKTKISRSNFQSRKVGNINDSFEEVENLPMEDLGPLATSSDQNYATKKPSILPGYSKWERDKNKTYKAESALTTKPPLLKSASDKKLLTKKKVLRQTNSFGGEGFTADFSQHTGYEIPPNSIPSPEPIRSQKR